MRKKYFKKIKKNGFTIIEMMIAIALFLIVVTIGMGALLNANLIYNKSQNMRSIMDSLNYIMDDMSRTIRTGYNYNCVIGGGVPINDTTPTSCHTGGSGIVFISADGSRNITYYIQNGAIFKSTDYKNSSPTQISPPEISIDNNESGFTVFGAEPPSDNDYTQPFVTIRLVGSITYQGVVTPFSLQTSVSQRLIDVGSS